MFCIVNIGGGWACGIKLNDSR